MITKFEENKEYSTRSICDHDCIFTYKVIKRTEKNIWIQGYGKEVTRRKVKIYNNSEMIYPEGTYSMCPVLKANR